MCVFNSIYYIFLRYVVLHIFILFFYMYIYIYCLFIFIQVMGRIWKIHQKKTNMFFLMKKVGSYVRHVLEPCRKSIAKRVC